LKFKREPIKDEYKYIIYSQRLSNQENSNQWDGIVGEFKNTMKREINKINLNQVELKK
jgi:hypothetical protein